MRPQERPALLKDPKSYLHLCDLWDVEGIGDADRSGPEKMAESRGVEGLARAPHLYAQWHVACGSDVKGYKGRGVFNSSQVYTE